MHLVKVITFGLFGLLLGIVIFQLDSSGYFERWEKISNQSVAVLNLFSSETLVSAYGTEIMKPCDSSTPEFSLINNYPKNITDCVQKIDRAADAYTKSTFIKDDNGDIWMWSFFSYAYAETSKKFFYLLLGFAYGMAIAFHLRKRLWNNS